eukprot:TRINITY_DN198683_c0_g1_i1.p2 TRINITY_DN198683_c0_g1~~TRINITY_DN198683_c0_g1_i1.p2  ORF type:complete len:106 (-),score=0.21 TRINITY_DN198683_c0_g1_i1:214-531(-)
MQQVRERRSTISQRKAPFYICWLNIYRTPPLGIVSLLCNIKAYNILYNDEIKSAQRINEEIKAYYKPMYVQYSFDHEVLGFVKVAISKSQACRPSQISSHTPLQS